MIDGLGNKEQGRELSSGWESRLLSLESTDQMHCLVVIYKGAWI